MRPTQARSAGQSPQRSRVKTFPLLATIAIRPRLWSKSPRIKAHSRPWRKKMTNALITRSDRLRFARPSEVRESRHVPRIVAQSPRLEHRVPCDFGKASSSVSTRGRGKCRRIGVRHWPARHPRPRAPLRPAAQRATSSYIASCCSLSASSSTALILVRNASAVRPRPAPAAISAPAGSPATE